MRFAVYLPPAADAGRVPALYWLSGLTCTEENFSVKSGAQRYAAELGIALIIPDTSPRGVNIPGEDAPMDVGTGAGFYVNATEAPWAAHYKCTTTSARSSSAVVNANLPVDPARKSISGHSMGGHGAIIIGVAQPAGVSVDLRVRADCVGEPSRRGGNVRSTAYLGRGSAAVARATTRRRSIRGEAEQARAARRSGHAPTPISTSCGPNDSQRVCSAGQRLTYRERSGYDHGYYFVSTFIEEHLRFHAAALR